MISHHLAAIYISNVYIALTNFNNVANMRDELQKFLTPEFLTSDSIAKETKNDVESFLNEITPILKAMEEHCDLLLRYTFTKEGIFGFVTNFKLFSEQLNKLQEIKEKQTTEIKNYFQYIVSKLNLTQLIGSNGICNGLSGWWGYAMANKNENQFYKLIHSIRECVNPETWSIDYKKMSHNKLNFEKFNAHIRWLHQANTLAIEVGYFQEDYDFIFENLNKEIVLPKGLLGGDYKIDINNQKALIPILENIPRERIIHITQANHVVSIFKRDDFYFYYDSNQDPLNVEEPLQLAQKLIKVEQVLECMSESFKPLNSYGANLSLVVCSLDASKDSLDASKEKPQHKASDKIALAKLFHSYKPQDIYNPITKELNHTFAQTICTVDDIETLRLLFSVSDNDEVARCIEKTDLLAIAFREHNISLIKSILDLEENNMFKLTFEEKNKLLNNLIEKPDFIFGEFNGNKNILDNTIVQLLKLGAFFTKVNEEELSKSAQETKFDLLAKIFDKMTLKKDGHQINGMPGYDMFQRLSSKPVDYQNLNFLITTLKQMKERLDYIHFMEKKGVLLSQQLITLKENIKKSQLLIKFIATDQLKKIIEMEIKKPVTNLFNQESIKTLAIEIMELNIGEMQKEDLRKQM